MFVDDDGLGGSRQPPEDDEFLRKIVIALKKLFEPGDLICRPTDTTAYREPPREDELRFGSRTMAQTRH
jgi:hypothetical protein